jgi:hypothetical protein
MAAKRLLILAFSLLSAWSHKLEDLGPIPPPRSGKPLVPLPRVLFFIHVPKCGGSTVRSIFKNRGWHMTYWSLTNRPEGWKANRILHSIREALRLNHSRIFVEWHLQINMSFMPELRERVVRMRPETAIRFNSFTILRDPVTLVSSTSAYWLPDRPADLSVLVMTEHLIFGIIFAGSVRDPQHSMPRSSSSAQSNQSLVVPLPQPQAQSHESRPASARVDQPTAGPTNATTADALGGDTNRSVTAHAACTEQAALCQRLATFEASRRKPARIATAHSKLQGASGKYATHAAVAAVSSQDTAAAGALLAARAAVRSMVASQGCNALVHEAVLTLRRAVDHILWLEDVNGTYATLHAVANGEDDSFRRPPTPWPLDYWDHPRSALTRANDLLPFKTPEVLALSRRENECSLRVAARLRSSHSRGHGHGSPPLPANQNVVVLRDGSLKILKV